MDVVADARREPRLPQLRDERSGELGRLLGILELALRLERLDRVVDAEERLPRAMRELLRRDLDVEIVELTRALADLLKIGQRCAIDPVSAARLVARAWAGDDLIHRDERANAAAAEGEHVLDPLEIRGDDRDVPANQFDHALTKRGARRATAAALRRRGSSSVEFAAQPRGPARRARIRRRHDPFGRPR